MSNVGRFAYRSLDELTEDLSRRGLSLPATEGVSVLAEPVAVGRLTVPNRLAIHPMEGCDGELDGSPGELTFRRYERFAAGGAGLVWFEACAVTEAGRANPRQLWLTERNLASYRELLARTLAAAERSGGPRPVLVLQLTHSGRYSRPHGKPRPIIARHCPVLDERQGLPADYPLISDDQLDALQADFVRSAELAAAAGFDAVDVKACHGYLLGELLGAFARKTSRYGDTYENRTRMLRETLAAVHGAVGSRAEVLCRLNAYDALAWPWGWGVDRADAGKPDLAEPIRLVGELQSLGLTGLSVTAANPYFNPHVNRPADAMIAGWPDPPEHPAAGAARLLDVTRQIQQAWPGLPVVGAGYTWFRQFAASFAAGAVNSGWGTLAGLGRGALAYPDFARDLLTTGRLDASKTCVTCSACSQIMRDGGRCGCVVRDAEVYGPIYREGRRAARE